VGGGIGRRPVIVDLPRPRSLQIFLEIPAVASQLHHLMRSPLPSAPGSEADQHQRCRHRVDGARPSRGFIFRCFRTAARRRAHGRGSLAFGGAISSLTAMTLPVQSNAALEMPVPVMIMVVPLNRSATPRTRSARPAPGTLCVRPFKHDKANDEMFRLLTFRFGIKRRNWKCARSLELQRL
jgi:hypothetical protein